MQPLPTLEEQAECYEVPFGVSRILEHASAQGEVQPLWLSAQETELLIELSFSSVTDGGPAEGELFAKLGRLVRSF
jgi:hypothetical protein